MSALIPSKCKGLNRFLALSINDSFGGPSCTRLSSSNSESMGNNTLSPGSPSVDFLIPVSVGGSAPSAPVTSNDVDMSPIVPSASPSMNQTIFYLFTTGSAGFSMPTTSYAPPLWPSANQPSFHSFAAGNPIPPTLTTSHHPAPSTVTSVHSGSTFNWHSDQSAPPPGTPSNFTPPSAPSLFNGSSVSSVKPSSSISACMEHSRKWKADNDDDQSVVLGALSSTAASTASSAQKQRTGNMILEQVEEEVGGIHGTVHLHMTAITHAITSLAESPVPNPKPDICQDPVHLLVTKATQKLLLLDMDKFLPTNIVRITNHFKGNISHACLYLSFASNPDCMATVQHAWLEAKLNEIGRCSQ
ncbi:hypothetical protein M404DRAFT_28358 [Pisolithus tinctorius Marx 270]|uniref:Uncharacterized protein n=1 Tax=Pisolithus tinctorius Marx 270 TaxID=870435 RepID=A0A0C3IYJ5_PISTI|nr:hypothetical protein M404DRAFT_28358 [Pisolithus tinctorius Marx 270]